MVTFICFALAVIFSFNIGRGVGANDQKKTNFRKNKKVGK